MISKKDLSERDICSKYINPALEKAGWNMLTQIQEEVSFTDGRIYVKGNLTSRGKRKCADYILYYKLNIPIAIIEAKDNTHSVKVGIQQGSGYAEILDIPSVYSSNGDGFYEHNRTCADGKIEFNPPPLTRAEPGSTVKKRDYFTKYGEQARKVLETMLDKYADEGIENIEDIKTLKVNPFDDIGTPMEIVSLFGGKKKDLKALTEFRTRNLQGRVK